MRIKKMLDIDAVLEISLMCVAVHVVQDGSNFDRIFDVVKRFFVNKQHSEKKYIYKNSI